MQTPDFKAKVLREGRAFVKHGSRSIESGRKIDYLSLQELGAHSCQLAQKYRDEKALYWLMKARVVQLRVNHRGLKLIAIENFNRKDVLSFYNNILAAHKTNIFGGKSALWNFLRDVTTNLNHVRQGYRFFKNTKSLAQVMKIYGGKHMCDLFILNFGGLSYDYTKHENKKGIQFIAGEHASLFVVVAQIYREAKASHGVEGPI